MKTINVNFKQINVKEYKSRFATEDDAEILIKEDTIILLDGNPIALYKKIDWCDTEDLRIACKKIKYTTNTRLPKKGSKGITTRSAIFGYKPRIPLRTDFCSSTSMAVRQPNEYSIVTNFAVNLTEIYKKYFPEVYNKHEQMVRERIRDEWKIKDSIFTSGIINKNNPLQYHHDTGNFKGVLSNMIAFRDGVFGGRLVMPEYNIKFDIADNTVCIFDGQSIVHGVTPLKKISQEAYRYTIVYYTLEQMWKCEPIKDEISRIRKLKKTREEKRLIK
jgi:hypothetical protein